MQSFVINLKRREDRKQQVIDLFTTNNFSDYSFYEAVDGSNLESTDTIKQLFEGNDFAWRKGVIGCALSHFNLWSQMLISDDEYYCIFEDDISILKNHDINSSLEKSLTFLQNNPDVDILFLGYHMYKNIRSIFTSIYDDPNKKLSFHPYRSDLYIGGFFSYIITKNFAKKMLKYINQNGIKHGIDYLIKINEELNVYECQPHFIQSDWVDSSNSQVDSDIQKDFTSLDLNKHTIKEPVIVIINNTEYKYYKGLDSFDHDIQYIGSLSIEQIALEADKNSNCVAFNSLGFLKSKVDKIQKSPYISSYQGLFVKIRKDLQIIKPQIIELNGIKYEYYDGLDATGHDLKYIEQADINTIAREAEGYYDCKAFNSLGFLKYNAEKLQPSPYISKGQGIFIKTKKNIKYIRVKMICNWCSSEQLCKEWNNMSKGNYIWNDIQITWEDDNIDYYVIINKPIGYEKYVPEKTIVFHMEPWCYNVTQNWGVKTWGEWAIPDEKKFLQVRSHKNFYNNGFWQLKTTYTEFKTQPIVKNETYGNIISTICSSKYFDPGHIMRIDFIKYAEKMNDPSVKIHVYNTDNHHNFKNYQGPHPIGNKDIGIIPYKYYFMGENNAEHNFLTEKIWEPLLTESLCFYWGCPNITDYINPKAFVLLDLYDIPKSFQIVKNAIENNLWEKSLPIIREEKRKVLEYYGFFPTIERTILQSEYKTLFKSIEGKKIEKVCFIHSCHLEDTGTKVLEKIILQIKNDGLYDKLDLIVVNNVGLELPKHLISSDKILFIQNNSDPLNFEIPTIKMISAFSKLNHNVKILYLHAKGITHNHASSVTDWTNYMMYFLVTKHEDCLKKLNQYDAVGCNHYSAPRKHYSGNFWWANTEYLKTLHTDLIEKHDCEWWVLSNTNNFHTMHNSGVNHYHTRYLPENYI